MNRQGTWASNSNIAVFIFGVLFTVWLGFQVWERLPGGQPSPSSLDPMVMTALGVAITSKTVEGNKGITKRADESDSESDRR